MKTDSQLLKISLGGNLGPRAFLAEIEGILRGNDLFTIHGEVSAAMERDLVERKPWGNNGLRSAKQRF